MIYNATVTTVIGPNMTRETLQDLVKRDLANKITNHIIEQYGDLITYNNVISQDYPAQTTADLTLDINQYPGYNPGGFINNEEDYEKDKEIF